MGKGFPTRQMCLVMVLMVDVAALGISYAHSVYHHTDDFNQKPVPDVSENAKIQVPTVDLSRWEIIDGITAKVPPFELEITMTDRAAEIVRSWPKCRLEFLFDGDGIPIPGRKTAPHRDVILGRHSTYLSGPGTIVIRDAHVSILDLKRLTDPNYHFHATVSIDPAFAGDEFLSGRAFGRVLDGEPTQLRIKALKK